MEKNYQLRILYILASMFLYLFASGQTGIVVHYPLDGNVNDMSEYVAHGAAYGAELSERYGVPNRAYEFDGSNNITVPSIGNWGDSLTISMWFKTDSLKGILMGNREGSKGSSRTNLLSAIMSDSTVRFAVASDAPDELSCFSTNKINVGEWNHVVFEQNRVEGTISIILNGERTNVSYTQTPRYLDLELGFGNWRNGYVSTSGLHGQIDDIYIYNKILSESEIAQLGDTDKYPLRLANYLFNEDASNSATDNAHGIEHGGNYISTLKGGAIELDAANNEWIEIPNSPQPTEFPIAVSALVSVEELGNNAIIFRNGEWSSSGKYSGVNLGISTEGKLFANFGSGNGAGGAHRRGKISEITVPLGQMVQLTAVYNSTTDIGLWINEEEIVSEWYGSASSMGYSSQTTGGIGRASTEQSFFSGVIDEVSFYNASLDGAAIETLVDQNKSVLSAVAHYKLNGNANNSIVNNNHGEVFGPVSTINRFNTGLNAFNFDGVDDYISCGEVALGNDYTITGWFKTTNDGSNNIIALQNTDETHYGILSLDNGEFRFLHRYPSANSGGTNLQYGSGLNDGQWHHFAMIYNSSLENEMVLFVDGAEVATADDAGGSINDNVVITIGKLAFQSAERLFKGSLDDFRIFNQALSVEDIATIYSADDTYKGIVRHYTLDGAIDESINGIMNGTAENAIVSSRYGAESSCYTFEGNNYLELPSINNWGDELSLSVWFKVDSLNTDFDNTEIINSRTDEVSGYLNFAMRIEHTDSVIRWAVNGTDVNNISVYSSNKVKMGAWNHAVMMLNTKTNTISLALNNITETTSEAISPRYKNAPIFLGGKPQSTSINRDFYGKIDDFKIYNKELSAEEIAALADTSQFPNLNALLAKYTFTGDMSDGSNNNRQAINNGAEFTTDRFGNLGNAYAFNGSTNYAIIDTNFVDYNKSFSVSTWFYPTTTQTGSISGQNNEYALAHGAHTSAPGYSIIYNDEHVRLINKTDDDSFDSDYIPGVTVNAWNHVAIVFDSVSNVTQYWLNGAMVKEIAPSAYTKVVTHENVTIGAVPSGDSFGFAFKGSVDDIEMYQQALSPASVKSLYENGTTQVFPSEIVAICEGTSLDLNNLIVKEAGTYPLYYSDSVTADSLCFIEVVVLEVFATNEEVTICAGEDYKGYVESGEYADTLTSSNGCDSIVTTVLTVLPVYEITEEVTICAGEEYQGYTESGEYLDTLIASNGCDSIITTMLTVLPVYEISEEIEICAGEDYKGYAETGEYTDTLTASNGCDSIVTTALTVLPTIEESENVTICVGGSYKGETEAGTYTFTYESVRGCDSVVTLELTVDEFYEINENVSICAGESYEGYTETGEYTKTLVASTGCDSIVNLNLTVNEVPEIDLSQNALEVCTTADPITLIANPAGGTFTGIGITNGILNPSEIVDLGMIEIAYEYKSEFGCTVNEFVDVVIKDCKTDVKQIVQYTCNVSPNPSQAEIKVSVIESKQASELEIINLLGHTVYKSSSYTGEKITINQPGLYTVKLRFSDQICIQSLIIE